MAPITRIDMAVAEEHEAATVPIPVPQPSLFTRVSSRPPLHLKAIGADFRATLKTPMVANMVGRRSLPFSLFFHYHWLESFRLLHAP